MCGQSFLPRLFLHCLAHCYYLRTDSGFLCSRFCLRSLLQLHCIQIMSTILTHESVGNMLKVNAELRYKRQLNKISRPPSLSTSDASSQCFLFFSSVVTTSGSPRRMPCQDKSTIQRRSPVLSVDVWCVLSPGGPIFNDVQSPFAFFVCMQGG